MRVIPMKGYYTFPKASGLDPHYQMEFNVISGHSLKEVFLSAKMRVDGVSPRRQGVKIIKMYLLVRETGAQSQVESYQRPEKCYLMLPCLTLSIIM